jgi:hypothetical protein
MILVGPWTGEVGYEVLCWIPFVRAQLRARRIAPQDVLVVSRGGVASWYADLAAHYVDLFDLCSVEAFRTLTETRRAMNARVTRRHSDKQLVTLPEDLALAQAAADRQGVTIDARITPTQMFAILAALRGRGFDLDEADRHFAAPPRLVRQTGPTAVKFYGNMLLPDTPEARQRAQQLVDGLADPLLLAHPSVDDHATFGLTGPWRPAVDPATNLGAQTETLQGCGAFVGTAGGFAYLASALGLPVRCYYHRKAHRLPGVRWALDWVTRRADRAGVPFSVQELAALARAA